MASNNSSVSIIIVEDSLSFRHFLEATLAPTGFTIYLCETEKEAIEKLESAEGLSIVTMDLNLGIDNGIQVAQKMISKQPDTKIICFTGFEEDSPQYQEAKQSGLFCQILTKERLLNIGTTKVLMKTIIEAELDRYAKKGKELRTYLQALAAKT